MTLRPETLLRTAFLLSLAAAASLALACDVTVWGNGEPRSETRELPEFSAIELELGLDVDVEVLGEHEGPPERSPVDAPTATLHCDRNLIGRIVTEVSAGTLHIHGSDDRIDLHPRTTCELVVQTRRLETIHVEGPGTIVAHGLLDELRRIHLEGPAELDADGLAVETLDVRAEGPAELVLDGVAQTVGFDVEGPVEIDADGLVARTVELVAEGPVDASVHASDSLVLDVEGPADIVVHGRPEHRDVDVEGPADIHYR